MSNLSIFTVERQQVRFVRNPERPEWVAADVVAISLYSSALKASYSKYLSKVTKEWKDKKLMLIPGRKQNLIMLFQQLYPISKH